ncbi:putative ubiquitin-protein ligase of the N-recognin family [Phytophthora cinnamomi]|uniref:putative ubiquitin-protein ligase of the N-recognin family n=1 Tax=Phytophthora cinnamomi TaxID=4785 RepID=UPI00355A8237|nr:putative ubiquitin-protein ligase of the N-recognin family [Phytophthora cinnamomi]
MCFYTRSHLQLALCPVKADFSMAKTDEAEHERRALELHAAAAAARSAGAKPQLHPDEADAALGARLSAHFGGAQEPDETPLAAALAAAPRASQRALTRRLLGDPAVESFPRLLQFLLRVLMAAHARSHESHEADAEPQGCAFAHNAAQACAREEPPPEQSQSQSQRANGVAFALPARFHACLAARYGSVKRLKCEEVWHGDHMAYRCRTCGLSDSSCMCLGCFDPDEHEGHDFRVYRCSSGGCCDCGDPLAWRPEGFCKRHRQLPQTPQTQQAQTHMHADERAAAQMLVRQTMRFCVDVLRDVHAACLRPHGADGADPFYPRRALPRTGATRSALPAAVKLRVDRLQHTLAWLQMLSMSCLHYRNMISDTFFEELPPDFQLDAAAPQRPSTSTEQPVQEEAEEDDADVDEGCINHGPMLMLDVFLKAGVLLPVETCDVLGVLYLKLLFDQSFKQKYTCHFVEWYPHFIELYLAASDENNEDGMRNLSRFIDRLFCQLFHSNAQLRELETVFAAMRPTFNSGEARGQRRRRRRRPHHALGIPALATDSTPSSCVEWLMVFLLEKLNDLFRSTLRLMTILPQPPIDGTATGISSSSSSTSTVGIGTVPEAPPVLRTVQAVDCGRNVFKKRIYARLCSDLRTLLVHPQIAAEVLLRSFRCIGGDDVALHGASVYAQLMKTFELLQQMDLQTRHIHRHIEYESQNWTFAFVADYELKLLLSAFLTGIPACFSREVWQSITTGENSWNQGATGVITGGTPLNPLETDSFRPLALARAILQPVRAALAQWENRNGRPEFVPAVDLSTAIAEPGEAATEIQTTTVGQLMKYYEQGTVALGGASAKSFHFPLHHMYAALIHALCGVVRPQTMDDWYELLGMGSDKRKDLAFWYSTLDHPLRVLLFSREIKAGLWVRNGGVMLQQLIHYHSKHWRYFGLHSDLFLCQLGASLLPHGSFTRLFFHQLPFGVRYSAVLGLSCQTPEKVDSNNAATSADRSRELRQELDVVEEALRLFLQLVLAPVKIASASSPETAAVWLLEREIMHWLTLGPFTRSELIMRIDMKLVEQIKQLSSHEWAELEEEEILTHVLENVGVYDDPAGSSNGTRTSRSGSLLGYGLKMSGSWKLKPELWSQVSPLFECFTPSEAQQCEQNIRKNLPKPRDEGDIPTASIILPMLPRPQHEGPSGVDMHGVLAETMLNSSYMTSILLVIFENYRRKATAQRDQRGESEDPDSVCSVTNENLLLAALHCLYVAVKMLPNSHQEERQQTVQACDDVRRRCGLDDIAEYFDEESSLFIKLCTDVPLKDRASHADECSVESDEKEPATTSLLSLLLFLSEHKSGMEDAQPVVNLILGSVREKSSVCAEYMHEIKRKQQAAQSDTTSANGSKQDNSCLDSCDDKRDEQPKLTAKEMMRKRQQQILEKMRSQQMQFLSANGDVMEDEANGGNHNGVENHTVELDTDSDSYDEAMDSDEDVEEDHEEEDEWGFPTGQVDLRVVAREKTLLQTDAVDSLQLRSMRQLADITAAAVAFSTPSSLAWTVVEAPADKQFESVMTRLNGLIFGQQVLFEEDEDACSTKWSIRDQLQAGDSEDATDSALVGTPVLCHPRLLTCFAMRIMWRQSIATPNADVAAEQLLTEAFFSARVLFTAQVLQALAYLAMQGGQETSSHEHEHVEAAGKTKAEIRDFEEVESLRDASVWISLMLARSRLMDSKSVMTSEANPAKKWNGAAMEEQVSALCLPLAQQMLLLMDVVLPTSHQHHSDSSQGDGDAKSHVSPESCAVCDGLFPSASTSTSTGTPSASALLDKCLRRLHLPPLRLFFHRQMFPSSQRTLCQLWGAQLEAKAAVSRQQARSQALVVGGSPTQVDAFPLQRQVLVLSSRAAAVASAGANYQLLISLPRVYMDLFIRYNEKPTGVCQQCAQIPQHPGLCLFCGEVLCCFSACCEAKEGGGVGECTQHAQRCGLGIGAFLLLRACTVILFLGNERRCVWGSLYVDKNGEEDPYLRRGKTLYLDPSRRLALETLLVSHSFSQNTAILQNTSRRDGRRY